MFLPKNRYYSAVTLLLYECCSKKEEFRRTRLIGLQGALVVVGYSVEKMFVR